MLEKIQKYETELWTVLCVLFFNIIAHGYRFVNLMFNGDSLLIYQTDQNWKYSIGRIFQPFYWKLRGDLVAPMLIATLAVFYFTAALVLIVRMFKLQNKLHIALLCALLAVNITTTSTFATDFHEGDTYMLALLWRHRRRSAFPQSASGFGRRVHLPMPGILQAYPAAGYRAVDPAFHAGPAGGKRSLKKYFSPG